MALLQRTGLNEAERFITTYKQKNLFDVYLYLLRLLKNNYN